ncbi:cytochrome c-type biogenesis protein [Lysobacter fragariae]
MKALRGRARSGAVAAGRRGLRLAFASAFLAIACAFASASALAQPGKPEAPPQFTDTAEEHRFQHLVAELRCVMCQNQSLADSNAQIARNLRHEVLELMRQGKSDGEIKQFLVARYGEFVLYRPQVESKTWLLWFGPALLLLAGGVLVGRIVRARSASAATSTINDDDQEW